MFEKNNIMRRLFMPLGIFAMLAFTSCDVMNEVAETLVDTTENGISTTTPALTNSEVIAGLKEALNVGIQNSVDVTSITDGFWKNDAIKLPFPEDANMVKEKALSWGLDGQVEKFELTLNRAAEEATKEALPIFKNAILGMSISDGFAILNGGEGAATQYLKDNTTSELITAFSPKVEEAISKVKLTDYWEPIITKYNAAMKITGGQQLNPDLNQYVTERAISGLFHMVEIEENKIREDPVARVTDLLEKVFGSIEK